jgi:signal peptidase
VLVIEVLGIGLLFRTGAWEAMPVLSGSMRPTMPPGSVVVAERVPIGHLRKGDVIVFHPPDSSQLVVHRIVSIESSNDGPVIQTKGDANNVADPWRIRIHGSTAYKARFAIPLAGYPIVWSRSPAGRVAVIAVGVALLVLTAVALVRDARRAPA